MNPSKVQMVAEKPSHYEMHDGKSPFKVPKAGLSDDMHAKIKAMAPKKMAEGGGVDALPERVDSGPIPVTTEGGPVAPVNSQGFSPEVAALIGQAQGAIDSAAAHPVRTVAAQVPGVQQAVAFDKANQDALQKQAEARAAIPAGVKPGRAPEAEEGTKATAPAAPAIQLTPTTPAWNPGVDRSVGEMAQATKDEQAAAEAKGSAEAEMARNQAAAFAEQQKVLQASALEQKAQNQRAHDSAQAAMAKVQAAREEMAKVDTTVDPGRYWASKSMPGKLAAIVGLALGAIGAGNDGINRAAGMIQQNIDRDIEAQKAEHEFRLKKGQAGVDAAQNLYAMNHAALQDDIAATAATKASGLELAENQLKQIAATAQSPIAKANAAQLAAQLQTKKAEFDGKAYERKADAEKTKQLIGLEQQKVSLEAIKAGAKGAPAATTGGIEALDRFEKQWKEGGGWTGKVSKHVPGTAANDLENISTADALAIATQMNGGKAPRPQLIELVREKMLPRAGESGNDGLQKIKELRRVLQRGGGTLPGAGGEAE